jgi:hypothetical protein|tara:strand:+ start:943 stop:1455 length:513 start_codon:yes stop_codon:yes gene_type:complete
MKQHQANIKLNTNNSAVAKIKLYPTNVNITQESVDKIPQYKYKEDNIMLLFSTEGIIQVRNDRLDRIKVIDVPTRECCLNNYDFMCDESSYIIDCEWFQIPKYHIVEKVKKNYYRLRPGALVELVVETRIVDGNNDPQPTTYFKTQNTTISLGVEEDIITFLAALKSNST